MGAKFGPLREDIKLLATVEMNFFRRTAEYTLLTQKELRNFGRVESRTSWRESKKIKNQIGYNM